MVTKTKKIIFLINKLKVGGAENLVIGQANTIVSHGYEPTVACLYAGSPADMVDRLSQEVSYITFNFKSVSDLKSWWRFYRYLRQEKFDIIVTNLFEANLVGRIVAVLAGVPYRVAYEHNVSQDRKRWQVVVDRLLATVTAKIIVGAAQVRDFLITTEKIGGDKILINHNAVELVFSQVRDKRTEVLARYGLPTQKKYLVTAGRLVEQKGHTYLLEALSLLRSENGLEPCHCLIFGDGVLQEVLAKQANDLGLNDMVSFYPSSPMTDILALSDIFVFPSLWEGLSLSLLGAMNAGCPIVATRVSGTEEAIIDGQSGLLVPPKDSVALAQALGRILKDSDLQLCLGRSAYDRSQLFSMEQNVQILAGLFDDLAK